MMLGVDILGIASKHWPVKRTINMLPSGCALGIFWDTFGRGKRTREHAKELLDTGKHPIMRIHPPWKNHVINTKREVKRVAKQVHRLCWEYPHIKFYMSCGCEHNCPDKKKVKKRIEIIKKYAPFAIPVNCPSGPGVELKRGVLERHDHYGQAQIRKPYIVSNDGKDISNMDAAAYINHHKNKAEIVFLWCYRFNLRDIGEGKGIPPKKRKKAPRREDFESVCKHL